ncbi:hypothetical protein AAF712_006756 [Marasmius tenuissimus]|uniref:Uncharacterized protein n=1 Tax=Marasmius tenuissimus TaxID=585030 RepID=A0ABR3A0P2_9AGAR
MGGFAFYDSEDKFRFHLWDQRFCKRSEAQDGCDVQLGQLKQLHPTPNGRDQYQSPLEYCVANKLIVMTEEEIKSLAIFQTLHFIANCIARGVNGLAITELEFFTLGFAGLNLATYSLWWHKPSRVRFPVRVMSRRMPISPQRPSDSIGQNEEPNSRLPDTGSIPLQRLSGSLHQDEEPRLPDTGTPVMPFAEARAPRKLTIRAVGDQVLQMQRLSFRAARRIFKYAWDPDSSRSINLEHGSILSAGYSEKDEDFAFIFMICAAIILGVFHGIPIMINYHDFPGHTEDHHLWTVFAIIITVVPYGAPVAVGMPIAVVEFQAETRNFAPVMRKIGLLALSLSLLLYAIARIALIALAIKQVIDLPPSALQQVKWTTLIPHFGV